MCDPVTAVTAAVGVGGSLLAGGSTLANQKNIQAMNAAQQQEIKLQQQQMELTNYQQQRQILRQAASQKAQAEANSVNQGAGVASSGILGGMAAISSNTGVAYNAVTQATSIGRQTFAAESAYANAQAAYQQNQGLASLGQSLVSGAGAIGRIGGTLFSSVGSAFTPFTPTSSAVLAGGIAGSFGY